MDRQEMKRLKEDFVANLAGTSMSEIFCVISCLPLCLLPAAAACHWTTSRLKSRHASPRAIRVANFVVQFVILVAPQLALCMSLAPAEPSLLALLLLWGSLALKLWLKLAGSPTARQHVQQLVQQLGEPRKRFVSAFRGGTLLYTCLAILAVDFHAFPRRFAKSETHGTGLMDIGVGAMVFAAGLVSAGSTQQQQHQPSAPAGGDARPGRQRGRLRALRPPLLLLLLGAGRLAATKAASYQEHVGEYGLHWNFFFTAAAVGLATQLLQPPSGALGPLALALALAHQVALSAGGLSGWVHAAERGGGWVGANKEGLGSLAGYWALHLAGVAAARQLEGACGRAAGRARGALAAGKGGGGAQAPQVARAARCLWGVVARLGVGAAGLWATALLADALVERVSRRACNLSYVLWVVAQGASSMVLCLATELLTPLSSRPAGSGGGGGGVPGGQQLLLSLNRNMLALFLAANLLTGAVNLSINTLAVCDWAARAIVGAYMLVVCGLAAALDAANLTLK